MTPFSKTPDGTVVVGFSAVECDIIADLAAQIAGMLGDIAGSDDADPLFDLVGIGGRSAIDPDPAIARLLPDAYGDDSEASGDFRRLTERSLASRKVANARVVIATLERDSGHVELDEGDAQAWLRTLSDIRLTIAARLGIQSDGDEGATDSDAAVALHDLYDWLAFVTESLLDALED
ncbi:DUF2017 domain-containing protein [Conyzicola sp.]|uniref:DUF2017 domain-containing protein n=1 Tax=Conyzicola sp. TaxID=1969404 RepID=UPI00398A0CC0